ncbi:MAG: hypothetical protein Tsb0032_19130 [Kiloniellaceae bacterium]
MTRHARASRNGGDTGFGRNAAAAGKAVTVPPEWRLLPILLLLLLGLVSLGVHTAGLSLALLMLAGLAGAILLPGLYRSDLARSDPGGGSGLCRLRRHSPDPVTSARPARHRS